MPMYVLGIPYWLEAGRGRDLVMTFFFLGFVSLSLSLSLFSFRGGIFLVLFDLLGALENGRKPIFIYAVS